MVQPTHRFKKDFKGFIVLWCRLLLLLESIRHIRKLRSRALKFNDFVWQKKELTNFCQLLDVRGIILDMLFILKYHQPNQTWSKPAFREERKPFAFDLSGGVSAQTRTGRKECGEMLPRLLAESESDADIADSGSFHLWHPHSRGARHININKQVVPSWI